MKIIKAHGPPGTGKTRWIIDRATELLTSVEDPSEVCFVSFSKAATREASTRIRTKTKLPPDAFRHWRTLHATAFHELAMSSEGLMGAGDWADFGRKFMYQFSLFATLSRRPVEPSNEDDGLLLAYHYGRALRMTDWRAAAERMNVMPDELVGFVRKLDQYKEATHKIDFDDLLDKAAIEGKVPKGLRYLLIDEAQDLSVLQWAYVEAIQKANDIDQTVIAFDPAQAIYSYAGADPEYVASMKEDENVYLRESHRLPDQIARYSQAISKDALSYYGRETGQDHIRLRASWDKTVKELDGRATFILTRSNYLSAQVAQELAASKIDYTSRGDDERHGMLRTALGHLLWAIGQPQREASVEELWGVVQVLSARSTKMPHGYKTLLEQEMVAGQGARRRLSSEPWWRAFDMALDADETERVFLPEFRRHLPRLIGMARERGPDVLLKEPCIKVMTIHQSKGKECERTILVPALPKRVQQSLYGFDESMNERNRAAEARLWYVAATRCREELVVIDPYDPSFASNVAYGLPEKPKPDEVIV